MTGFFVTSRTARVTAAAVRGSAPKAAPLALAAAAAGADGLMIEVHDRPEEALSDGRQALTCGEFARLARRVQALTALLRQEE